MSGAQERRPRPTIRATSDTLPYGAVTNEVTDGWAIIDLTTLEVSGEGLYRTVEEALAAAAERRRRDRIEDRANRDFDEEVRLWDPDSRYFERSDE